MGVGISEFSRAVEMEVRKEYPAILKNLIGEAQKKWEAACARWDDASLRQAKFVVIDHELVSTLEEILKKDEAENARECEALLDQFKADEMKLDEIPEYPFEETLKKYEELEKSR